GGVSPGDETGGPRRFAARDAVGLVEWLVAAPTGAAIRRRRCVVRAGPAARTRVHATRAKQHRRRRRDERPRSRPIARGGLEHEGDGNVGVAATVVGERAAARRSLELST